MTSRAAAVFHIPAATVLLLAASFSLAARPSSPLAESEAATEASVHGHMEMLASDALNGRGSGTRDEWLAATYVASQLRRFGLEPIGDAGGFVREVQTPVRELIGHPAMTIGDVRFVGGREMHVRRVGAAHVSGSLVRWHSQRDVPDGAIVVVSGSNLPPAETLTHAAAVIGGQSGSDDSDEPPLVVAEHSPWLIELGSDELARVAGAADGTRVTIDAETRPGRTWNVLARIAGRDPHGTREAILLSAHIDHLGAQGTGPDRIYNGADDDASGSTAVLELARLLEAGRRPDRTLLFAWFGSEEEDGRFGVVHFRDHPPVPLASIVANLEFEMIGRPDPLVPPGAVWLTGFERTTLGPALASHGAPVVADPRQELRFFERSDNIELARRGVVAQVVSTFGLHDDYHTPADDLSRIDFPHLTEVIRAMVRPIAWLANSTFTPAWRPGGRPDAVAP